jgi:hypothetical protein
MNTSTEPARDLFVSVVKDAAENFLFTINKCTTPGNRGDFHQLEPATLVRGTIHDVEEFLRDVGYPLAGLWETGLVVDGEIRGKVAWVQRIGSITACPVFDWCEGHDPIRPVEDALHMSTDHELLSITSGSVVIYRVKEQDQPERFEVNFRDEPAAGRFFYLSELEEIAAKFEAAAAALRVYRDGVQ